MPRMTGTAPVLARRAAIASLTAACVGWQLRPEPALAQQAILLFKVISPRDEVMIGLTAAEQQSIGGDVGALAKRLVADGQITVWKYVVGRGPNGDLRHIAQAKIAVLRSDTLRIEPYAPALPVAPPP